MIMTDLDIKKLNNVGIEPVLESIREVYIGF